MNGKSEIRWNFAIGARTEITYEAYNIPKSDKNCDVNYSDNRCFDLFLEFWNSNLNQ